MEPITLKGFMMLCVAINQEDNSLG